MNSEDLYTYLNDSRFPAIHDTSMDSYYFPIFETIRKYIGEFFGVDISFHLVYSMVKRCETIQLDNETTIIYDRYLGETLNMMTKTYLLPNEDERIFAYNCKLLAETLRRKGQFREALPYAIIAHDFMKFIYANDISKNFHITLKYFRINNQIKSEKIGNEIIYNCNFYDLKGITLISELYVMLHETAHVLFHKNLLVDFIDKNRHELELQLEKHSQTLETIIAKLKKGSNYKGSHIFKSKYSYENIFEEIVCDRFALESLFYLLDDLYDANLFVISILLTSHHLRYLKRLEDFADKLENLKLEQYYDSAIRGYINRENLSAELKKNNLNSDLIIKSSPIMEQYYFVYYNRLSQISNYVRDDKFTVYLENSFGEYFNSDFDSETFIIDSLLKWNNYKETI